MVTLSTSQPDTAAMAMDRGLAISLLVPEPGELGELRRVATRPAAAYR
jgi:hypothetical protein